jgi:hypothetical protein
MKASKNRLTAVLLALIVTLVLATPVLADPIVLVGERFDIVSGEPTEYPAGDPFYIPHAGCMEVAQHMPIVAGKMGFALEVDGKPIEPDFDYHFSFSARSLISRRVCRKGTTPSLVTGITPARAQRVRVNTPGTRLIGLSWN